MDQQGFEPPPAVCHGKTNASPTEPSGRLTWPLSGAVLSRIGKSFSVRRSAQSYTNLAEAMFTMQSELFFFFCIGELTKMRRTQELLHHNLAAITKEWVEVNPDISNMLLPRLSSGVHLE